MQFLRGALPRFVFFTGRGGVGKTSIACATAIDLPPAAAAAAGEHRPGLQTSGGCLAMEIGNRVTPDPGGAQPLGPRDRPAGGRPGLPRDRIVGRCAGSCPTAWVKVIRGAALRRPHHRIAAFDEFAGLLVDSSLTHDYQHIVFDAPPWPHPSACCWLPGAWRAAFWRRGGRRLLPRPAGPGLEEAAQPVQGGGGCAGRWCAHPAGAVARAQQATLREVARTHDELAAIGIDRQFLVINGLCRRARREDYGAAATRSSPRAARPAMPAGPPACPPTGSPPSPSICGGAGRCCGSSCRQTSARPRRGARFPLPPCRTQAGGWHRRRWPRAGDAGWARAASVRRPSPRRWRWKPPGAACRCISPPDPAAHLAETLEGSLDQPTVSRIDPPRETVRYRQHVLDTQGAKLDAQGRALLEKTRSPCTEEIAVFQAFSRIIRGAQVCGDGTPRPTGHTPAVADATGAITGRSCARWAAAPPFTRR